MRKLIMAALAALVIAAFAAVPASATPTGTPGQPNQDCEALLEAGGSQPAGFGTPGFANAQQHYAGSEGTPSAAHGSSHAVSQYDVASSVEQSLSTARVRDVPGSLVRPVPKTAPALSGGYCVGDVGAVGLA